MPDTELYIKVIWIGNASKMAQFFIFSWKMAEKKVVIIIEIMNDVYEKNLIEVSNSFVIDIEYPQSDDFHM